MNTQELIRKAINKVYVVGTIQYWEQQKPDQWQELQDQINAGTIDIDRAVLRAKLLVDLYKKATNSLQARPPAITKEPVNFTPPAKADKCMFCEKPIESGLVCDEHRKQPKQVFY